MKKTIALIIISILFSFNAKSQKGYGDFAVIDIYGEKHILSTYLDAGKHVLLEFFSSSCYSCHLEASRIDTAYRNFGCNSGDVVFLGLEKEGVNIDIWNFMNGKDLTYPIVSGREGKAAAVFEKYNIPYTPHTVLLNPEGKVIIEDAIVHSTEMLKDTLLYYGLEFKQCEGNDFLYYGFIGKKDTIVGEIDKVNQTVTVNVPHDYNISSLSPIFANSSNSSIYIGDVEQESEITVNDFSMGPILYRITSEVGEYKDWTVFVNSISEVEQITNTDIAIYPNPASNFLEISSKFKNINFDLKISDIKGKVLYSGKIDNINSRIDISKFAKGIYIANFRNRNTSFNKKVVIQ